MSQVSQNSNKQTIHIEKNIFYVWFWRFSHVYVQLLPKGRMCFFIGVCKYCCAQDFSSSSLSSFQSLDLEVIPNKRREMATQYYRDNTHPKGLCSPYRRRRFGLLIFILLGFFFYFVPWELPASLKGAGFSSLSRANVVKLIKSKKVEVGEIYGLLHIVTGDNEQEHILSNVHLDPTVSVEMSVYAAGDTSLDWEKERQTLDDNYPIVVFSKVYYFPPQLFANYRDLNIFTDILLVNMMSLFIVQELIPIRQFIQLFIECQTATGGI